MENGALPDFQQKVVIPASFAQGGGDRRQAGDGLRNLQASPETLRLALGRPFGALCPGQGGPTAWAAAAHERWGGGGHNELWVSQEALAIEAAPVDWLGYPIMFHMGNFPAYFLLFDVSILLQLVIYCCLTN